MPSRRIPNRVLYLAYSIIFLAVVVSIWLEPPPGTPPGIEKAHDEFIARYPLVTVADIGISRDEASTRSFTFDYRHRTSGVTGRIEIHYARRSDGKWEAQPEPPAQLP